MLVVNQSRGSKSWKVVSCFSSFSFTVHYSWMLNELECIFILWCKVDLFRLMYVASCHISCVRVSLLTESTYSSTLSSESTRRKCQWKRKRTCKHMMSPQRATRSTGAAWSSIYRLNHQEYSVTRGKKHCLVNRCLHYNA